ncbi:hypothetical protein U9939_20140, partial [Escherichia coli]
ILTFQNHTNRPLTDFGGKTSIFSHPVYLFLREFSLQDFRGGSDPQAHQVLVETLLNLQAERIRLADKANFHIHRLLNISGGHRHA